MYLTQNTEGTQEKKGLSQTQIIVIIGFSIVLIVVVVGLILLLGRSDGTSDGDIDLMNDSVVITDLDDLENLDTGNSLFYVRLNTLWTFEDSSTPSEDAVFANYYENTSSMYATVEIPGIDGAIYKSPVLKPGTEVQSVKLSQKVDPGAYDAVCIHHILNANGDVESTVQVALTIVVKN